MAYDQALRTAGRARIVFLAMVGLVVAGGFLLEWRGVAPEMWFTVVGGLAAVVFLFWWVSGMWFRWEEARQSRADKRAEDADPDHVAPRLVIRGRHAVPLYVGIIGGMALQWWTQRNGISVVLAFAGLAGMFAWARHDREVRKDRITARGPWQSHEDWTTRNRPLLVGALVFLSVAGGMALTLDGVGVWDRFLDDAGAAPSDVGCGHQVRVVEPATMREGTANVPADPLYVATGQWRDGPTWTLDEGVFAGNVTVAWQTGAGGPTRMDVAALDGSGNVLASSTLVQGGALEVGLRDVGEVSLRLRAASPHVAASDVTLEGTFQAESWAWSRPDCNP